MKKRKDTWSQERYEKALREKYGDKFKVEGQYVNCRTPLKHRCREHGIFRVPPIRLLRISKHGCPECGGEVRNIALRDHRPDDKLSDIEFAKRLKKAHPQIKLLDKYQGKGKLLRFECVRCSCITKKRPKVMLNAKTSCDHCDVEKPLQEKRLAIEKLAWPLHEKLFYTPKQIAHLLGMKTDAIKGALARKRRQLELKGHNGKRVFLGRFLIDRSLDEESRELTFHYYARQTQRLTGWVLRNYGNFIRNLDLRSTNFHVDHVLSTYDAFHKYNTPLSLKLLCHPANLRVIHGPENIRKSKNSHSTLRDLKKKIKKFQSKNGKVTYPDYWVTEYAHLSEADEGRAQREVSGLRVLALDPGIRNFGYAVTELYGASELKKVNLIDSGYIVDTIDDFKPLDMSTSIATFKTEIRKLIKKARPDIIVIERYQTRGIKGVSGEYISAMIGIICSMVEESNRKQIKATKVKLVTAAQWKNRVNAEVPMEQIYKATKQIGPHRMDAFLMSMYMFPEPQRYKFLKTKLFKAAMRKYMELEKAGA